MRCWETIDGRVKDENQIEEILFVMHGKKICGRNGINFHIKYLYGIKREITDFNEWKDFAHHDKVGAMRLYRELTGCGLMDAKRAIDAYVESEKEMM